MLTPVDFATPRVTIDGTVLPVTPGSGGSNASATAADLERLKDDIRTGLRQALREALSGLPGAAAGLPALPSGDGGGVNLTRAELEAFLFDRQVLASDSGAQLMAYRLRELYGRVAAVASDDGSSYEFNSVASGAQTPVPSAGASPARSEQPDSARPPPHAARPSRLALPGGRSPIAARHTDPSATERAGASDIHSARTHLSAGGVAGSSMSVLRQSLDGPAVRRDTRQSITSEFVKQ